MINISTLAWGLLSLFIGVFAVFAIVRPHFIILLLFGWFNFIINNFRPLFGDRNRIATDFEPKSVSWIESLIRAGGVFCLIWVMLALFIVVMGVVRR